MYKVDIKNKTLVKLDPVQFTSLKLKERYDIEEWIEKEPQILGEELLIISKEYPITSTLRLDLLAIDKNGELVVIELKKDDSGANLDWQAVKYASYCSNLLNDDIFKIFAKYFSGDEDEAQSKIEEFLEDSFENLNENQRIILVSKEFHSDVISAVLWLRDYEINIECLRLIPYLDKDNNLYITPDLIIPLPEAKDYIKRKETKIKESKQTHRSTFSLEKSNLQDKELIEKIKSILGRNSDLTPRLFAFLEIISADNKIFNREEIKEQLHKKGVGKDIGQSGRFLSNISQFLTKKSNPFLRQIIEFETGGSHGETKDNYRVVEQYRSLLQNVLKELSNESDGNKE